MSVDESMTISRTFQIYVESCQGVVCSMHTIAKQNVILACKFLSLKDVVALAGTSKHLHGVVHGAIRFFTCVVHEFSGTVMVANAPLQLWYSPKPTSPGGYNLRLIKHRFMVFRDHVTAGTVFFAHSNIVMWARDPLREYPVVFYKKQDCVVFVDREDALNWLLEEVACSFAAMAKKEGSVLHHGTTELQTAFSVKERVAKMENNKPFGEDILDVGQVRMLLSTLELPPENVEYVLTMKGYGPTLLNSLNHYTLFDAECPSYNTLDNGGNPFLVRVISSSPLHVLVFRNDSQCGPSLHNTLVFEYSNVTRVIPGIPQAEFAYLLGNSVMIELSTDPIRYVYVHADVIEFSTPFNEPIIKHYSFVGNNDVPYPGMFIR
jgi:hypothetical protein